VGWEVSKTSQPGRKSERKTSNSVPKKVVLRGTLEKREQKEWVQFTGKKPEKKQRSY